MMSRGSTNMSRWERASTSTDKAMTTSPEQVRGNRSAERVLGLVLLARAVFAIALARWLIVRTPGWDETFHGIAKYALADSALAFITAVLFGVSRYRGGPVELVVTATVDGIVRLSLGAAILLLPTIAQVPMTVVPLFGVVGATAALLGGLAILSWAVAHHRRQREHSVIYEAFFDPIPVVALVCIVIGAMLATDPPSSAAQLRPLVSAGGIAVAVGFAIAGAGSLLEGFRGR
jgi:hypothetical protein